ncbi:Type IV secretory pathway, VirD4 component, TraG/TraD family ATPase [Sinosporangium album]|uniref:Type IV secretory pathway, VirD4 component, TraG/TraD family ATPase n=1 Tax=Sinosporangium album TaxID=504805 RepID=A0A1G8L5T3_9ACTN|nr:type IV secretory system conjugative DNA transfer family protein [Sinosporangium album]SDI51058.1 Type IV secretory pathway, VirD4 component, TraG/TraD family ATPase [Sinosporangium album]
MTEMLARATEYIPTDTMPWDLGPGLAGWVLLTAAAGAAVGAARRSARRRQPWLPMRIRLRLGMHPGPGFAGLVELYRGYGRGPARRVAARSRPSLTWRDRWFGPPNEYAVFLGWGRPGRRRAYATLKDVTLTIAPPQQGKSAAAAGRIIDAPGPVVATSIRGDLIAMTAGVRQQFGLLHVFNPAGVGDYGSTFRWNLVAGCQDPEVAIRRAGFLVAGVRSSVVADSNSFWHDQATLTLAGYLQAGGLAKATLRVVHRWIVTRDDRPLQVLQQHEGADEASLLAVTEFLHLPERTQASVATTIRNVLKFMAHPAAAEALEPRVRGELFDVEQFLNGRDTLYMVASSDSSELAPLFLCFVAELYHAAVLRGSRSRSQALDPPLSLVLDEVANICPIPVHSWATYSGGSGVALHLIGQAWAHLKARWGDDGADVIWQAATCKIFYTASSDTEMGERVSKLAGDVRLQVGSERVSDGHDREGRPRYRRRPIYERVPVLPVSELRRLPDWHAVVIRGSRKPTVVRVERGWQRADYKRWVKSGQPIMLPSVTHRPVPVPRPELLGDTPHAPVPADELTSRRERRQGPAAAPPLPLPLRPAEQAGGTGEWRPWDGPGGEE